MTTRETYALLRCCNYINDISKVYKDWIRADRNVVGFWAHTNSNLGKEKKLERISEWCKERNLPVTILNDESHLTRFKIKINYEKEQAQGDANRPKTD